MPAEARREQLLDATKAIVDRDGFHAVSIEAVAREAGITRPIVYGHFHDLPRLLDALVDREGRRALDQLGSFMVTELDGREPDDLLLASLRGYLDAAQADPATWRLVLIPPEGAPPSLRERIAEGRAGVIGELARTVGPLFAERVSAPDPELVALTLTSLADVGVRLLLEDPERYPPERIVAHSRWVLDQLLRPGAGSPAPGDPQP